VGKVGSLQVEVPAVRDADGIEAGGKGGGVAVRLQGATEVGGWTAQTRERGFEELPAEPALETLGTHLR